MSCSRKGVNESQAIPGFVHSVLRAVPAAINRRSGAELFPCKRSFFYGKSSASRRGDSRERNNLQRHYSTKHEQERTTRLPDVSATSTGNEWFVEEGGVKFGCTLCGKCCSLPGVVWINDDEVNAMADHLQLSKAAFAEEFAKPFGNGWWQLRKKADSTDCALLENNLCRVNPVKPVQCATYPYWPDVVTNPGSWMVEGRQHCEGINHPDAPVVTVPEIRAQLDHAIDYFTTIRVDPKWRPDADKDDTQQSS